MQARAACACIHTHTHTHTHAHTHTHTHTQQVIGQGAALVATGVLPRGELTAYVLYVTYISQASADVGDQWAKIQGKRESKYIVVGIEKKSECASGLSVLYMSGTHTRSFCP